MQMILKSMPELIEDAKMVSFSIHRNAMYDIFPYEKHIKDVVQILINHGYGGDDIIGAYLHDGVEDGNLSYRKIHKNFGYNAAEIVLAVTDPIDARTREEQKEIVIKKINAYPKALPTKLADRIANITHGIRTGNHTKLKMYVKEHAAFETGLRHIGHVSLWKTLDEVMEKAVMIVKGHSIVS